MFTEAISELKAVKTVRVRPLGNRNPDAITIGLNLARALRDGGYLRESDQLYLRLADAAESLEPGHRHRQSVRAGWARMLAQLGRYEAAEVQLTEAHALRLRDPRTDRRRILHLRADLARGGSFSVGPVACRGTFRNWDYPIRRQIFSGFRTARDAAGQADA
ncbi:hypothetical protein ACH40F_55485 [Streptomyces sp. NPDC020794]|uniref:hypothetical protein n=1 Tax=unclassified Streptomyces TaxID=2593676 RepID=UPI0036EB3934